MTGVISSWSAVYPALALIALGFNGFNDLFERKTCSIVFLAAAAAGIFLSGRPVLCVMLAFSAWFLPDFRFLGMGAGDLEAVLLIVTCFGRDSLYALLFGCVAGIIFWVAGGAERKCSIPFVFCLFVGTLAAVLCMCILLL